MSHELSLLLLLLMMMMLLLLLLLLSSMFNKLRFNNIIMRCIYSNNTKLSKKDLKYRKLPSTLWRDCGNLDIEGGTCKWETAEDGYFKDSNLTMRLILEQKCGINVSTNLTVDTTKIGKLFYLLFHYILCFI